MRPTEIPFKSRRPVGKRHRDSGSLADLALGSLLNREKQGNFSIIENYKAIAMPRSTKSQDFRYKSPKKEQGNKSR
jgi:hypothetical protein